MAVSNAGEQARRRPGVLRRLPEIADAGMYLVDDHGRIVEVNDRAVELLARSAEELLGQDAHELLHRGSRGEDLPRAQCLMMQAFLDGRTAQGDQGWFERGDGTLLPLAWLVSPCALADGRTGAVVIFHESALTEAAGEWSQGPAGSLSELERLALLAETTTTLSSTLDMDEALRRLLQLVVPRLADWAVVDLITERDEVWRTAVVHYENGALRHREDLEGPMPPVPQSSPMPLSRALRGVAATLAGPETYQGAPDSGIAVAQQELFRETGIHSAAIAPIRGAGEVLGALTLGRGDRPTPFAGPDLSLLEDITRRAGLALSNAQLYQRQRRVAETMQRHLLPRLPTVPGLEMTARYLPAPHASHVGGDWYDAFVLPDGAAALVIGDVVGHDLDAAAGMAQVRNMLRALAWSHRETPKVIVERLDQVVTNISEASMATMVFARVQPAADGGWHLHWTNAGHPPPLLVGHDGQSRFLDDGHGMLLGTGVSPTRRDAVVPLPELSTVVFYTDGLVESPRHSIDDGLARLRRHAASLVHRPLDVFCDLLLSRVRPAANDDDVAMLALRVPASEPPPAG